MLPALILLRKAKIRKIIPKTTKTMMITAIMIPKIAKILKTEPILPQLTTIILRPATAKHIHWMLMLKMDKYLKLTSLTAATLMTAAYPVTILKMEIVP